MEISVDKSQVYKNIQQVYKNIRKRKPKISNDHWKQRNSKN